MSDVRQPDPAIVAENNEGVEIAEIIVATNPTTEGEKQRQTTLLGCSNRSESA